MTQITHEAIEAAKSAYWHEAHNGGGYSDKCYEAALTAALPFLSPIAGKPDMLRLAVAAVLEADKEFRANMPPEWEGDPLSDEIDGLRRVFSSTLPIAGEVKVKPLQWEDQSDDVLTFHVTRDQLGMSYVVTVENLMTFVHSGSREVARFPSLAIDKAKAAAQTDYETRIISSIPQFDRMDPDLQVYARQQMAAALSAALSMPAAAVVVKPATTQEPEGENTPGEAEEPTRAQVTELLYDGLLKDYERVVDAYDAERAVTSELLEALHEALLALDGLAKGEGVFKPIEQTVVLARTAISKAEGRS